MVFGVVFLIVIAVAAAGFLKLWSDVLRLRFEIDRLRETQDTLIDMVSSKLLEDEALSREFLRLKRGPRERE